MHSRRSSSSCSTTTCASVKSARPHVNCAASTWVSRVRALASTRRSLASAVEAAALPGAGRMTGARSGRRAEEPSTGPQRRAAALLPDRLPVPQSLRGTRAVEWEGQREVGVRAAGEGAGRQVEAPGLPNPLLLPSPCHLRRSTTLRLPTPVEASSTAPQGSRTSRQRRPPPPLAVARGLLSPLRSQPLHRPRSCR